MTFNVYNFMTFHVNKFTNLTNFYQNMSLDFGSSKYSQYFYNSTLDLMGWDP